MKYSIKGSLNLSDGTSVVALLNRYNLWKLETKITEKKFSFEVWLNNVEEKNSLFEAIKPYVDDYGGVIDWHECTHDEPFPTPCVIVERYGEVIR